MMLEMADKHLIGFETLLPVEVKGTLPLEPPPTVFYSDLRETIRVGLSFPICYMELWTAALNNPENEDIVRLLKDKLIKRKYN